MTTNFRDPETCFMALQAGDPKAIAYTRRSTLPFVKQLCFYAHLSSEDAEEIIHDSIGIALQKMEAGKFVYTGYHPSVYVTKVSKMMILSRSRQEQRWNVSSIDALSLEMEQAGAVDITASAQDDLLDKRAFIQTIFAEIPVKHQAMMLMHWEDYSDAEILKSGNTSLKNADSIKATRNGINQKLKDWYEKKGFGGEA